MWRYGRGAHNRWHSRAKGLPVKRSGYTVLVLTCRLMLVLPATVAGPATAKATMTWFSTTQTIDFDSITQREFVFSGSLVKWTCVSSFMDPIAQTGYIIDK